MHIKAQQTNKQTLDCSSSMLLPNTSIHLKLVDDLVHYYQYKQHCIYINFIVYQAMTCHQTTAQDIDNKYGLQPKAEIYLKPMTDKR